MRVPSDHVAGAHVELRSPDPSCNPYLALACIIASGLDGIRRKANAVAEGAGAPKPTVEVLDETTPALFNDEKLTERLGQILRKAIGDSNVVPSEPTMGGEDFSRYGRAGVPICMFRLGSGDPVRLAGLKRGGQEPPSLHSSVYYPDAEKTLLTGITAMTTAVIELLPPKK